MKARILRMQYNELKLTLKGSDERQRQILTLIGEIINWIEEHEQKEQEQKK